MNYDATPQILTYGMFNLANFDKESEALKLMTFFIMPLYEMNLKQYLSRLDGVRKIEKIIDVTNKLVSIFKYIHCAKRTFNDLKLENIMINTNGNLDADPEVFLIDFGFAKKFLKKDGKTHLEESKTVDEFSGNIHFASGRQMNFLETCRKDDLVSLFYLLIFMLNDQCLWVGKEDPIKNVGKAGVESLFNAIETWKKDHNLNTIAELLCK